MNTTTITDRQIADLQNEAARAGDDAQVALCEIALGIYTEENEGSEDQQAEAREACADAIVAAADMDDPWTFEGYWNTVLGADRSNEDVIREFDLDGSDRAGLDEWISEAEVAAWQAGGGDVLEMPAEWVAFHGQALDQLHMTDAVDSDGNPV